MKKSSVGKIISISDLNIKILLSSNDVEIKDILYYEDEEKNLHRFEIVEMDSNIALAIPFESVNGVKKGIDLYLSDGGLQIEYSSKILGKMFNSYGDLIDGTQIKQAKTRNVYDKKLSIKDININGDVLWTGIKVIDFFAPLQKGYKMGLIGGAGVGKTVLIKELINNTRKLEEK